ncbi:docking protein 1 [Pelodytes ibericus]
MSGADRPIKEGQLHVKQNKFGKKWKRCYVLLYPDSPFGVARLEFYDWKDGTLAGEKSHTRRAGDRKIVRLAECICVALASSENGHKENMAAFTLETNDKTILLSTERALTNEWIQRLCEIAFPNNLNGCKSSQENEPAEINDVTSLEMAVNSIYFSREEVSEYRVTVQRTEAAERCSLRGSYILRADAECLILKDMNTKETLYCWPYKLLRRYGRDKVMFSFEAGRRCTSGAGNFTFETSQGHEIFQKVESSIRAQQEPENRLSNPALDSDIMVDTASRGPESPNRKDPEEKPVKGRILPNLPGGKPAPPQHLLDSPAFGTKQGAPNTPPRSPVSKSLSPHSGGENIDLAGVYSEPKDSVRSVNSFTDPLYSDPVDLVRGQKPKRDMCGASPLYADLYEQVTYDVVGVTPKPQSHPTFPPASEEHIYDEPEGIAQPSEPLQLYSEVRMEGGAWKKQASDEKFRYEYPYNPPSDDYSVPNLQGQRSQPRNKTSGPKPVPAPKPQGIGLTKLAGKELDPDKTLGQSHVASSNNNTNNSNNIEELYSQIQKPACPKGAKQPSKPPPSKTPAPVQPQCVPVPIKPPALPHPNKPFLLPGDMPSPLKPPSGPVVILSPKPLPTKLQPTQPPLLSALCQSSVPIPQASQSSTSQGKEVSVDGSCPTSIYEDMGVL